MSHTIKYEKEWLNEDWERKKASYAVQISLVHSTKRLRNRRCKSTNSSCVVEMEKVSGVLRDTKIHLKLKRKFYRTTIRPTMYTRQKVGVRANTNKISVTEMMMLRWMFGKTIRDKIRNENVKENVGVAHIVKKIVENRLRWFVHVARRPVDLIVRKVDQMECNQTTQGRRIPKKKLYEKL